MTKALTVLVLLLSAAQSIAASLSAAVDRRSVALGQQIKLTLSAQQLAASLEEIDLRSLQGDFDIFDRAFSSSTVQRGNSETKVQVLELYLIALRAGQIRIPQLQLGNLRTQPIQIAVSAGSSDFPHVLIKSGFVAQQLYQRAETTLYLDLYDDSTFQWAAPVVHANSMQLRAFAPVTRDEQLGAQRYRVTRFSWGAMPLRAGAAVAGFGLLAATHFGQRVAFRAPSAIGDVASVPMYLPLTLHIGKLSLLRTTLPHQLRVGRPEYWLTQVSGRGISVAGLKKSIAFPVSDEKLFFYPPKLISHERADGVQVVDIVQPFKPLRGGDLEMPELRIPFYDPVTGDIHALGISGPQRSVRNPFMERLYWLTMGGIGLATLAALGWVLRKRIRCHLARMRTLHRVRAATTPEELLRYVYADKAIPTAVQRAQTWNQIEALVYGRSADGDFNALREYLLHDIKSALAPARRTRQQTVIERVLAVAA